jgi:hypothetical protein
VYSPENICSESPLSRVKSPLKTYLFPPVIPQSSTNPHLTTIIHHFFDFG